mgnify:CR=1 FL=1
MAVMANVSADTAYLKSLRVEQCDDKVDAEGYGDGEAE